MSSSSASLEVSFPTAHSSRVARFICPKAASLRTRPASAFLRFTPLRVFAVTRSKRCGSNWRTCGVGRSILSIAARLRGAWIDKTLRPSSSISPCGCNRCNRSARSRQIQPYRAPPLRSGRPISHHAPARPSARCSATRGGHSRPGRAIACCAFAQSPPSLHFSPGGTLLGFSAPLAGLLPQTGVAPSLAFRAHVSFRSPRVRPD